MVPAPVNLTERESFVPVVRPVLSRAVRATLVLIVLGIVGLFGMAVVLDKVDLSGTVTQRLQPHAASASKEVYEDSILYQPAQHIKQRLPHLPTGGADCTSGHGTQRAPVGAPTTDTHSIL